MSEFVPTAEQSAVLRANTEVAEASGILDIYTFYHPLRPEASLAFTAQTTLDGLRIAVRQVNSQDIHTFRGTSLIIGDIAADFTATVKYLFEDPQLVVASRRVLVESHQGLDQFCPARKRPFINKWLGLQAEPVIE